jgi:hypothetical protein
MDVERGRTLLKRRWPTLVLAALVGSVVLAVALFVFPYHSNNHDEGVYLQQAAMLLEGELRLYPPVEGAFRPWFFIDSASGLYPKYSPVPAAIFAVGLLLGEPRISLAMVAAGSTALVVAIAQQAFDRATGLVAGVLLLTAPLFVISSSVFLPYAPTFLANLGFAYAYVRMCRERSVRWATVAGLASGIAFFARPYTAVLFAAPIAAHSLWVLTTERRAAVPQYAALVGCGLAMVAVTLAYNAVLTGAALRFPYQAFAPLDGLGFGERRILDHSMQYTPGRALEANGYLLWYLATRWGPLGAVGTALAFAGVWLARSAPNGATKTWLSERQLRVVILGVFASVAVGNVYFWGNANALATPTNPRDGLLGGFGPFYHFDTLLALTTFTGYGIVRTWRELHERSATLSSRQRRAIAIAAVLVTAPLVGGVAAATFGPPLEQNTAYTEKYEQAYEPFEPAPPTDAVVFVPTPYGPWLNHPFQYIRNDPGFDGRTVYAQEGDAETSWAVLDAFQERRPYRYRYRGEWTAEPMDRVEPSLQSTERVETDRLQATTRVGIPQGATSATVTLSADEESKQVQLNPTGERLTVEWNLTAERLSTGNASVPIAGATEARLTIVVVGPQGATTTYEQELLLRPDGERVGVVWPPEPQVCLAATTCDDAYVPDSDYPPFVSVETERR